MSYRFAITVLVNADTPERAREIQDYLTTRLALVDDVVQVYAPAPVEASTGAPA
jgi:hypothetical protein